jgi:hypothetical protein
MKFEFKNVGSFKSWQSGGFWKRQSPEKSISKCSDQKSEQARISARNHKTPARGRNTATGNKPPNQKNQSRVVKF